MRRKTEIIIIIIIIVSMDFFWVNLECCRIARVSQPQLSFIVFILACKWLRPFVIYNNKKMTKNSATSRRQPLLY